MRPVKIGSIIVLVATSSLLRATLTLAALLTFVGAGSASAGPLVGVSNLTDSPDPVRVGEDLTYSATVSNGGTDPAPNVEVRVTVPEGTRFASSRLVTASGERACPPPAEDRGVTCPIGDLRAGEEATMELVAVPVQPGWLENLATVSSDSGVAPHVDLFANTRVLPPEGCTVVGTGGVDRLAGTPGPDTICAFGGGDAISGGEGEDTIYAGGGNDVLRGGEGEDRLVGGLEDDELLGGRGGDTLRTRDAVGGNDEAYGGPGKDAIYADRGDHVKD